MDSRIFLCLGSNRGDRKGHLETALEKLRRKGVKVQQRSSFYWTEPVDVVEQPTFLNLVCEVETSLNPESLLKACLSTEKEVGRVREKRKGPRRIDVDILFYGQERIRNANLTIPHPALYQRNFVLIPLEEIAPEFPDPVCGKSIRELRQLCRDRAGVRRLSPVEH